ncbi:MAG: DUF2892 domain-containing protein [Chloroflexi bacterium]|nr:DUF2892 domain-containing protein [Chloroflexota bacterium]MBP8058498.1 DUF2892 domain-containing protein [Chloroflexota bacterium]
MTTTNEVQPQRPVNIHLPLNVGLSERWLSGIAGFGLTAYGISRASLKGLILAVGGGYLMYRGISGYCPAYAAANLNTFTGSTPGEIKVKATITINKPVSEVYTYWRHLENLPTFMKHLTAVTVKDDKHSHWSIKAAAGLMLEWDAEIIAEQENQLLAWRSLPGATITNMGLIYFKEAPGGRGTEVKIHISYNLPGGIVGELVTPLLNKVASKQIKDDLRYFKQLLETGEAVSVDGQSSGRTPQATARPQHLADTRTLADLEKSRFGPQKERDLVDEMGWESFPASDPPASW